MTWEVYLLYKKATAELRKFYESSSLPEQEEMKDYIQEYVDVINDIDERFPHFKESYAHEQSMKASFTKEQQDWICSQIGNWYLTWKGKMWIDGDRNTHWLGLGKEELKEMICGD